MFSDLFKKANKGVSKVKRSIIEKELQPLKQTKELEKQTSILAEAKKITEQNAEYTKKIVECSIKNQDTAKSQFRVTLAISITAIIISVISLYISINASIGTEVLYKQQLQKQDEIIKILKQNKSFPIFYKIKNKK